MKIIRTRDMVSIMNMRTQDGKEIPFSVEFVTCDEKLGEGGDVLFFDEAVIVGSANSNSKLKNPNNYENFTRNIRHLHSDRITKVDAWLIRKFNGMEVQL